MMKKGEFRERAQRFLTGEFHIKDLDQLFLFLRQQSFGHKTVRDIGHMIGHADARNKGISVERVSDLYDVVQFKVPLLDARSSLNITDAPHNLIPAMEATFRLLEDGIIKRDTGLRRDQASTALTRIKKRFQTKLNGRIEWTGPTPNDRELALITCLTQYIISRPAYDGDLLFAETSALLLKHGFMDPGQERFLVARKPHLLLYAIAAMHGVHYRTSNGGLAEAEAGWSSETGEALLGVSACIEVETENKTVNSAFPIFTTDLLAKDWTADFSPDRRNTSWTVPIELTQTLKLRTIN